MLSEHDVRSDWRNLFQDGNVTPQTLRDAERLVDQLPLESPLRPQLSGELDEIRALQKGRKK